MLNPVHGIDTCSHSQGIPRLLIPSSLHMYIYTFTVFFLLATEQLLHRLGEVQER